MSSYPSQLLSCLERNLLLRRSSSLSGSASVSKKECPLARREAVWSGTPLPKTGYLVMELDQLRKLLTNTTGLWKRNLSTQKLAWTPSLMRRTRRRSLEKSKDSLKSRMISTPKVMLMLQALSRRVKILRSSELLLSLMNQELPV
jgi:hypothetical protein